MTTEPKVMQSSSAIAEIDEKCCHMARDKNNTAHIRMYLDNFKNKDGTVCCFGEMRVDFKYVNLKPGARVRVTIEEIE